MARIVRVKLLKREVLVACARGNQLSFEGRGRNVPCKETWCRRQRLAPASRGGGRLSSRR